MFLSLPWLANLSKSDFKNDLGAGVVGGILAFPQAIGLATLAGMPPQYGIYTSLIPVLIALLWGSSWFTLSGPNMAVSVMLGATILPVASLGTERYIELIFLLSLFVGIIQLTIGALKMGLVLDFISSTVILAIVQAVAIILLVSSVFSMSLIGVSSESNIFSKFVTFYNHRTEINYSTVIVGLGSVLIGLLVKQFLARYYLLIAMLGGVVIAIFLVKLEYKNASNIPLLGAVPLTFDILQFPKFSSESLSLIASLWDNALAIAFLGLMQTVVISRSIAYKSGQIIVINREIIGQGLANTIAPFTSAFAGSASFNRMCY